MVFSSYQFIFLFFPIVLTVFHLLRRLRKALWVKVWLVASSLVFYGVGQPDFLFWFILSGIVNYLLAAGLSRLSQKNEAKWGRRGLLFLGVGWNIGLLFYFKYLNFFLEGVNFALRTSFPMRELILPLGISFFTFQMLTYVIGVFQEEAPLLSPVDYGVFVTFFPQLIVGPVVKQEEIQPQLEEKRLLSFDPKNIGRGIMLFSVGCGKKILLANPMIDFATAFYGGNVQEASLVTAWAGVLAYFFAYYFDFSGYIDMARGIGHLFGIELPINFNSPYKARNFAEFWRRWNMTISRFFNESVFSNLFRFGDGVGKLIFATLMTFLASGLWHGADWHYLVWGGVNGVLVCCANIMTLYRKSLPKPLAVGLTLFFSVLVRVLFDCNGMTQAFWVYKKMFSFVPLGTFARDMLSFVSGHWALVLAMVAGAVICFCFKNSNAISRREQFGRKEAVFCAVVLMLSIFNMSQVSTFLYFNF